MPALLPRQTHGLTLRPLRHHLGCRFLRGLLQGMVHVAVIHIVFKCFKCKRVGTISRICTARRFFGDVALDKSAAIRTPKALSLKVDNVLWIVRLCGKENL